MFVNLELSFLYLQFWLSSCAYHQIWQASNVLVAWLFLVPVMMYYGADQSIWRRRFATLVGVTATLLVGVTIIHGPAEFDLFNALYIVTKSGNVTEAFRGEVCHLRVVIHGFSFNFSIAAYHKIWHCEGGITSTMASNLLVAWLLFLVLAMCYTKTEAFEEGS
jgi:hypothetical protein